MIPANVMEAVNVTLAWANQNYEVRGFVLRGLATGPRTVSDPMTDEELRTEIVKRYRRASRLAAIVTDEEIELFRSRRFDQIERLEHLRSFMLGYTFDEKVR